MQGLLLLAFPLFFIGLSRRREQHRVQKLTSCRGLNLPVFEQMGFQTHHDWVLGEEEECTESYFPCLFPASSDTSSTFMFEEAKSAMQETHRRNSSSTVLRFEQKLSPGDDERFGILYSSSSSGDGLADIARQELGRPFLVRTHRRMLQIGNSQSQGEVLSISLQEGGEQASKRHCSNVRKQGKAKSCASKDPQGVAAKNRRERISERLKILQELVPNGTKVDLVTMLEKAISYVKFLQLQVKVLATDEFWPVQGGKAPEVSQVKEAMDAILSSNRVGNCSFQS